MRLVCWFSCGAASAVATKLAIADNAGRLPVVAARCIVREEHPDNDRFSDDCQRWFGVPITNLIAEKFDGSIYEVFKWKQYISGRAGDGFDMELTLTEVGCRNYLTVKSDTGGFSAEFCYRSDHAEGRDLHEALIALGKYLEVKETEKWLAAYNSK